MKQILHKSFALKAFLFVAMMVSAITGARADEVTLQYTGETSNMTGGNDAAKLGLIESDWSVVGDKGGNSNYPGLNKAGDIRLYYHAERSNTLTVSSLNGATINNITMEFTGDTYSNAKVLVDGSTVTPEDGKYSINSSSFVITNGNASNVQVRIKTITINYTPSSTPDPSLATTTKIDASGITNTDIYAGTNAGQLTAEVTDPEGSVIPNPELTWSSSNESVATIAADGTITLVAVGTTTITVSYPGVEGQYKASNDTYNLTVIDSTPFEAEDGIFDFGKGNYGSGYETGTVKVQSGTWTAGNVTMVTAGRNCWFKDSNGNLSLRVYKANGEEAAGTITFSVPADKVITKIEFTGKDFSTNLSASTGSYVDGTWTGSANTVSFTAENATATVILNVITVTYGNPGETPVVVPTPTFNPAAGEVVAGATIEIICPAEADGVEFSYDRTEWTEYADPITITEATTIYARAYDPDGNYSEVVSAAYTVKEETPAYETVSFPYTVDFMKTQDKFVIEDKELSGLTYVWKRDSKYGMKASAYANQLNNPAESWLVSPLIDLTANTGAVDLSFEHATNHFATIGNTSTEATVWVRTESGQWTQLEVNYPEVLGWDFVQGGTVDLSSYNGNKIQIGFKYVSSSESCGTWEIKNFTIQAGEVVEKLEAGLSYSAANYTATIGEENEFPVLANPNSLTVTYSSTNESVATVDEEGNITLLAAGQTTIKATSEEDDTYAAGSASYLLVVKDQEVAGTDKYELVTDASTLKDGDIIVIAFVGDITNNEVTTHYKMALSTTQNSNNRAANEVTVNEDGTITPGSSIQQITLEGETDAWYFNVGNGYLYAASKSSNQLKTEAEADDNAKATFSISDGNATILFQGDNTRNDLRFNPNSGNPIFSCYDPKTTKMTLPQIYRKVASDTPAVEGDVNKDGKLTIADVTALVNIILGHPGEDVDMDAANVNGDDKVTIADVTALVNKILKQ